MKLTHVCRPRQRPNISLHPRRKLFGHTHASGTAHKCGQGRVVQPGEAQAISRSPPEIVIEWPAALHPHRSESRRQRPMVQEHMRSRGVRLSPHSTQPVATPIRAFHAQVTTARRTRTRTRQHFGATREKPFKQSVGRRLNAFGRSSGHPVLSTKVHNQKYMPSLIHDTPLCPVC